MQDNENISITASEEPIVENNTDNQKRTTSARNSGSSIKNRSRNRQGGARRRSRGNSGRRPVRRSQARRRRKRNLTIKICLFIFIILALIAGLFLWKRYSPSKEKADLQSYYGLQNEEQLAVILNDEVMEPLGMISDGKAYLQFDFVHDYLNERFYWDSGENKLLYTLPKDVVSVEVGSTDYLVSKDKNTEDYVILKTDGSTAYIALEFVQKYTNIDFSVYDDPQRVVITSDWGKKEVATVKKNTQIRYRGGVKSDVLSEVSKGSEVHILDQEKNWTKVCSEDGFVGYIKKSALKKTETKKFSRDFEEPEYTSIKKDYTICIVWHNTATSEANSTVYERLAKTSGVNTICPTWYHVSNTSGDIQSISDTEYVDYCHKNDVEVWATLRDFDGGINSTDESLKLLSSTEARNNLINQLIADALSTNIDGINLDFEKISTDCGDHYIQFVRELSVKCRQNDLVLSIDNYVPQNYNTQYNRKEQGVFADYVVIMGYDEYYGGSPVAGPGASYTYVKNGIEATLEEVPAEKVISGMPFFTRLWTETPKTESEIKKDEGTDAAEYENKVESSALTMAEAVNAISEAGADKTWDDDLQMNYATWKDGDKTYEMWLEDSDSLEAKIKLVKENELAGCAFWALGQEKTDTWKMIQQYVN